MSWIKVISFDEAGGQLKKLYKRVTGPHNNVDNIMQVHSLRPHTMEGHMMLYKNVLHHQNNSLPKPFMETIGIYVSYLNKCDYCVQHHFEGLKRHIADSQKSDELLAVLKSGKFAKVFSKKESSGLVYARKLTLDQQSMVEEDILSLRTSGYTDGEILELNQVISYFNYANRTVLGLGVTSDGDILGLSPKDNSDPNNWSHS